MMTKDQYANYVVQKMLEVSTCWHAVLCCAVLCCAVLCCAVLCCAVLCCAVLWSQSLCQHALASPIVSACRAVVSLCQHAVLWCHSLCQHAGLWCTWLSQHAVLWSHSLCQHAGLWCTWLSQHAVLWSHSLCQHAGRQCITTPYRICFVVIVYVSCRGGLSDCLQVQPPAKLFCLHHDCTQPAQCKTTHCLPDSSREQPFQ